MIFRLRTIETTAQGRQIVRDRDVADGPVTLGRSADNTLHLADLSLDPHHATICGSDAGRVEIEAVGSLGFTLDGRQVRSAVINPQVGGELGFGGYRIAVSQDTDGAVLLTIGLIAGAADPLNGKTAF